MKPAKSITALAVVVLAVLATSAPAQVTDLDNLRSQIERNEELLKEAETLVRATSSVKARASLEAARKLHEASLQQLNQDRPLLAARAAVQAREAILRTIAIAKREAKLEENALKMMERATTRLEQAKGAFDDAGTDGNLGAKKLIDEAQLQLQRAKNNYQEHMFEVALHLAEASVELSNRAINLLRRDSIVPEQVMRELGRTDRLLEAATEHLAQLPDEVARAVGEAQKLQDRAKQNGREGRYRLALEMTRRARALARRSLEYASGSRDEESVAHAVELTDRLLEEAFSLAAENDAPGIREPLEEAARLQDTAKDQLAKGHTDAALRTTLHARDRIRMVMRDLNRPIDPETVRRALQRTDAVLDRVREAAGTSDDPELRALFERAQARQATAWEAFEAKQLRRALANTKIARNLARRVLGNPSDDQD